MALETYTLSQKKKLTNDVYELIFTSEKDFNFVSGQFITFILSSIGGRAYSILNIHGKEITLIIKRRDTNNGGRGGSIYICDKTIGETLMGVGPAGRFVLQQNNKNKLFLGTGTGFVPLYNQIIGALELQQKCTLRLIFGVRNTEDLFYINQLKQLEKLHKNFHFDVYVSRDHLTKYNHGYITEFLTLDNIEEYEEFYICGAPGMIDASVAILKDKNIEEENIFTEKY
ncbi:FAD-dependent oxidoreductase [Candidatus Gracilibacteria bacterium 28_42_T64]|nr:FAD-dependent oxidoreductase [Candidatus Gracilibacteria bacterium 28_42_T64]